MLRRLSMTGPALQLLLEKSQRQGPGFGRGGGVEAGELAAPHANVAVFVLCADTEARAQELRAAKDLMLLRFGKGERGAFSSDEETRSYQFPADDRAHLAHNRRRVVSGTPKQVHAQLTALADEYAVDEIAAVTITADFEDRRRSYELLAEVFALDLSEEVKANQSFAI